MTILKPPGTHKHTRTTTLLVLIDFVQPHLDNYNTRNRNTSSSTQHRQNIFERNPAFAVLK